MVGRDHMLPLYLERGFTSRCSPSPRITKPKMREKMNDRGFRSAVSRRNLNENIVRAALGVFHKNIEITVIIENPGIDQLVFRIQFSSAPIFSHQRGIGELPLRILIENLEIRMRGSRIQVVIELLDILAVISFFAG